MHVELFTPSHADTKSTIPLQLCHKSQMLSQTVQLAFSGGARGGAAGTRAPFRLCPGSWLAAGRQRQQQPVDKVEPDAADDGDWRMRAASDVTADTPTPIACRLL